MILMTLLEHNLLPVATAAPARRAMVKWTSMRREADGPFAQVSAILVVEMLDDHRAMVEMWVEDRARRRSIQDRTLIKAHTVIEHGLLHIDAADSFRLTIKLPQIDSDARLMYAQCGWLERAGFTAGTFDRPSADLTPAPAIAASA